MLERSSHFVMDKSCEPFPYNLPDICIASILCTISAQGAKSDLKTKNGITPTSMRMYQM